MRELRPDSPLQGGTTQADPQRKVGATSLAGALPPRSVAKPGGSTLTERLPREATHVVAPGETLQKIAAKYKVTVEELKAANAGQLRTWPTSNGGPVQGFMAGASIVIPGPARGAPGAQEAQRSQTAQAAETAEGEEPGLLDGALDALGALGGAISSAYDELTGALGGLWDDGAEEAPPHAAVDEDSLPREAKDKAPPPGTWLFQEAFEVVDGNAKLRDATFKATGKNVAKGTKVYVVRAERTYVQIVTSPDAAEKIAESDQAWTAFSNLGGTGAAVGLGNEGTDEADKQKADELRDGLPPGRNPGKSPFKWQFSSTFQPSLEGKALDASLMTKVQRLMQWTIENDMVTSDIVIGDGMRGPKTAHQMCVAWNIQYRWGSVITLDALKQLPGGKDHDGTTWYQENWTEAKIKENAQGIRASDKIAAAGYEIGNPARAPLPISPGDGRPGVSRHCTGRAVDVTIPWRAPGQDAAKLATDVWAWEAIYQQFGLHRPLHKSKQSDPNLQENWHIEETDKQLDGAEQDG